MHVVHMHTFFSRAPTCSTCMLCICIPFSAVYRPVLHACYTYAYLFSRTPTCSTCMLYICIPFSAVHRPVLHACCTYAYLFSRTATCSTRHTYAYLFQPEAEVKEGVAGVCERCARCSYPQVFTVQQHVQMSVCVHPHPDTTARSDLT